MPAKIRLSRIGGKKRASYRVVVADSRVPRDGRYIELIGRYDPRREPSLVEIDADKAKDWIAKGAQPTEPVVKLLEIAGVLKPRPKKVRKPKEAPAPKAEEAKADEAEPAAPEVEAEAETAEPAKQSKTKAEADSEDTQSEEPEKS